jgi:MFS family permease
LPDNGAPAATLAPIRLHRDRVTVALYAHFVAWGWLLYSFAPSVPLLAREMRITKAQAGLHGTAMAAGTVVSALISARLVGRFGRRVTLLVASGVLALGVVILVSAHTLGVSLPGVAVIGIGGTLLISAAQPALSLHHSEASAAAGVEANGVGSLFGLLAPLAVGASVAVGWGWRPAVSVTIVLAGLAAVLIGSLPGRGALGSSTVPAMVPADGASRDPEPVPAPAPARRGFSGTFWFFWVGSLVALAIETATTFWAADLLIDDTGAGPGIATGAVAGLVAGMSVSRFVVGPISMRRAPPHARLPVRNTIGLRKPSARRPRAAVVHQLPLGNYDATQRNVQVTSSLSAFSPIPSPASRQRRPGQVANGLTLLDIPSV